MAGLGDVERALVSQIAAALELPNWYQPGGYAASGVAGVQMRVYRGWPIAATLDDTLLSGAAEVSVYPGAGMARLVTRYLNAETTTQGTATMTATVAGNSVAVGGTVSSAQVVGVLIGVAPLQAAYAYRPVAGDTASKVAAALAALVPGATSSGAVLTVAGLAGARVGADGATTTEVRRVQQAFRIGVWAPSPALRDVISDALDAGLGAAPFITAGADRVRITYQGTQIFERTQQDRLWRRDIAVMAEYPTTVTIAAPPVLWPGLVMSNAADGGAQSATGALYPPISQYINATVAA